MVHYRATITLYNKRGNHTYLTKCAYIKFRFALHRLSLYSMNDKFISVDLFIAVRSALIINCHVLLATQLNMVKHAHSRPIRLSTGGGHHYSGL